MEWFNRYNIYFIRHDGLVIQSGRAAKGDGRFLKDILCRGDLISVSGTIKHVLHSFTPRFVTYSIGINGYLSLVCPMPGDKDVIISHELKDPENIRNRRVYMKMLRFSVNDLFNQIRISHVKSYKHIF